MQADVSTNLSKVQMWVKTDYLGVFYKIDFNLSDFASWMMQWFQQIWRKFFLCKPLGPQQQRHPPFDVFLGFWLEIFTQFDWKANSEPISMLIKDAAPVVWKPIVDKIIVQMSCRYSIDTNSIGPWCLMTLLNCAYFSEQCPAVALETKSTCKKWKILDLNINCTKLIEMKKILYF